jgi:2-(1,2-epoxy-1,2-dihydrophenyl)acetyl-CoA isomerase
MLQKGMNASLDEMLDMEMEYQQLAGGSDDHREGVKAFSEKRAPKFEGK